MNFIRLMISFTLLVLASGCGNVGKVEGAGGEPPVVRLGYFANITHAQALLGVSQGTFQQAIGTIPLKTNVFNAGPSAVEALFAGELDLAYVGPGPALNAFVKSHGEAVRVIAGAAANGVLIVARKDSGITKMEDLKGKRIATPQYGNTQDISARAFLKHKLSDTAKNEGGTTDIQAIANSEQIGLFKQGQLDASWAPEPWGSRLVHEAGGVVIAEEKDLWPEKRFAITLLIVSKKFLDAYPGTVEKILKAHVELTDRLRKSPQESAAAINAEMKRLLGKEMSPVVLSEALSHVEFTTDPLESSVQTFSDWSAEVGFGKEKTDAKPLFDLTLLRKLKR